MAGVGAQGSRGRRGRPALLVAVGLAAVAALLAVLAPGSGESSDPPVRSTSTLETTLLDTDGNGVLEVGPDEPLIDRTELAPASESGAVIAELAQISDAHVRDEESPARATLLDRIDRRLNSAFRPQEALSPQVLAAAVESVNAAGPDAVVVTGDLLDSAQRNELEQALAILAGGRVRPDSGGPGYRGPQQASNPDPFLYRPDLDAPRHPGLLDQAQLPFRAPGLDAPWYPTAGNHDLLVQGEVPPSPALESLATGDRLLTALDDRYELPEGIDELTPEIVEQLLAGGLPGRTARVPADPERSYVEPAELAAALRDASDAPGPDAGDGRLDYSFPIGDRAQGIVLDVVDRSGGSEGRVAPEQLSWLRRKLRAAGERWILVFSHQPLASSVGGERALALLDHEARVVAAISGHTHRNSIEPRASSGGEAGSGYWLIGTASLADYPQQARELRLVETTGGGVALQTWMLDGAPDPLADSARDLAFLDAQGGRPQGAAGEAEDRNATLYLPG